MASTIKCKPAIECMRGKNRSCDLLLKKWKVLQEFVRILKLPFVTTNYLQRECCTLSDFFGIMVALEIGLKKEVDKSNAYANLAELLQTTMTARKTILLENRLIITAIYLDPRYNCELTSKRDKISIARQTIANLWCRTSAANRSKSLEMNASIESDKSNSSINLNSMLSDIDRHYEESPNEGNDSSERNNISHLMQALDAYEASLNNNRANSNQNVLEYWEKHKCTFSIDLYHISKIIHSIPPTQAAIERLFSGLNFIFTDRRYKLRQSLLEDILLLHSNIEFFNAVKSDDLNQSRL